MRNVTEDVKKIVRFVQENCEKVGAKFGKTAQQNRLTLNMLVDIFLGLYTHVLAMKQLFCNCESSMIHVRSFVCEWSLWEIISLFQGLNLPRYSQECLGWEERTQGITLTVSSKNWFWITSWRKISTSPMAAKPCLISLLDPNP